MRALAFAALAVICALRWADLLASPPAGRIVAALVVVAAGCVALSAIPRLEGRPARKRVLATVAAATTLVASLIAIGVPAELLLPGGWDELERRASQGVRGLGQATYPYDGAVEWSRLILLAAVAAILSLAAALTFWPRREAGVGPRLAGLGTLLGGYAIAVAISGQKASWLAGPGLLALVAAWLWLPHAGRRRAALALGVVAIAAAFAVPAAAALDPDEPWIDYEDWTWEAVEDSVVFDWDHRYGPIDWPRDGTTLLEVESDEPHYWRAAVLDRFQGTHWARSDDDHRPLELPAEVEEGDAAPAKAWTSRAVVTVRSLRSPYVVSPGRVQALDGVEAEALANGMTVADTLPEPGSSYEVTGYEPDPTAAQLRRASDQYAPALRRYTRLELASSLLVASSQDEEIDSLDLLEPTRVPLWAGSAGRLSGADRATVAATGYASVYRLARSLTAGQRTPYAAVRAVERHLEDGYLYSEESPIRARPLQAFLLRDRTGYCQQFSGAMALMLRMAGIPTRVASGFSPGSPTADGGYEVTDLDAHSWVEVYFSGIGWVPFDPTPGIAPAELQAGRGDLTATPGGGSAPRSVPDPPKPDAAVPPPSQDGGGWGAAALAGLAALAAAGLAAAAVIRARRFRALAPQAALDAQVREIRSALAGTGQRVPPGVTLRAMERRLARAAKPRAAAYLGALRSGLYAAGGESSPTPAARRAVRRELRGGWTPRSGLRSLLAMPPGGPRPARPRAR